MGLMVVREGERKEEGVLESRGCGGQRKKVVAKARDC